MGTTAHAMGAMAPWTMDVAYLETGCINSMHPFPQMLVGRQRWRPCHGTWFQIHGWMDGLCVCVHLPFHHQTPTISLRMGCISKGTFPVCSVSLSSIVRHGMACPPAVTPLRVQLHPRGPPTLVPSPDTPPHRQTHPGGHGPIPPSFARVPEAPGCRVHQLHPLLCKTHPRLAASRRAALLSSRRRFTCA